MEEPYDFPSKGVNTISNGDDDQGATYLVPRVVWSSYGSVVFSYVQDLLVDGVIFSQPCFVTERGSLDMDDLSPLVLVYWFSFSNYSFILSLETYKRVITDREAVRRRVIIIKSVSLSSVSRAILVATFDSR